MKSIWIHDYTNIDRTFGPKITQQCVERLAKSGFDTIIINNTNGLGEDIVNIIRQSPYAKRFKVYQWILEPFKRNKSIEKPLKNRDGFILDIEPLFIKKPKDLNIRSVFTKWGEHPKERKVLCLPSPDFIISYKIRGYVDWINYLKETNQLDYVDFIMVMEYVSYPNSFFKPLWLIKLEVDYLKRLSGKKVIPIFSVYDWNEWFAKLVINKQIKLFKKAINEFDDWSVFAWSYPLYSLLRGEIYG